MDVEGGPELVVEGGHFVAPGDVGFDYFRGAVFSWGWREVALVVFEFHEGGVHCFDVAEGCFAVGDRGGFGRLLAHFVLGVWSLDVEEWAWSLGVAEGDLAERAFHDEGLVLGSSFCGLDCASDLLLHALDVVIATSRMMSAASIPVATTGLKEVSLRELIQWLTGSTSRRSANLRIDLVIKSPSPNCSSLPMSLSTPPVAVSNCCSWIRVMKFLSCGDIRPLFLLSRKILWLRLARLASSARYASRSSGGMDIICCACVMGGPLYDGPRP